MYEYLLTYMYVRHMCAWAPRRPDEGVRSPGTAVTGGYEPLHGWWKTNPCPLKVHKVFGRHASNSPIYVFIKTAVRNKLLRKIMYFLKAEAVFKIKPPAIYAGSNRRKLPRKLIWGWRCTREGLLGASETSEFSLPRAAPGKLGCTVTFPWDWGHGQDLGLPMKMAWLSLERENLHTKNISSTYKIQVMLILQSRRKAWGTARRHFTGHLMPFRL